jgi:hypothetical protein
MSKLFVFWLALTASARAPRRRADERGDVPGWVLITVMTAGLVAALWAIAGPQLSRMLTDALSSVKG